MSQNGVVQIRVKVDRILPKYVLDKPGSDFSKTEIIGSTLDLEHPQKYKIEFMNKKQELLQNIQEGCFVTLTCNLRGREYTNEEGDENYFMNLDVWKAENIKEAQG